MEERGKGNLSRGKSDGETIFNLSPTRQSETILSLSFSLFLRNESLLVAPPRNITQLDLSMLAKIGSKLSRAVPRYEAGISVAATSDNWSGYSRSRER